MGRKRFDLDGHTDPLLAPPPSCPSFNEHGPFPTEVEVNILYAMDDVLSRLRKRQMFASMGPFTPCFRHLLSLQLSDAKALLLSHVG